MASNSHSHPSVFSPSAALAAAPASAQPLCYACYQHGHTLLKCPEFLSLLEDNASEPEPEPEPEPRPRPRKGAVKSEVATHTSLLSHSTADPELRWIADSGATSHMTHCVHLLQNTRPHRAPIRVANGLVVYSELVGEIVLRPLIHGHARSRSVILSNVLYVPALSHNLISTTYLSVHHDYTVLMKENYILFKRNGEVYFVADISEQGQALVRETGFPSAGSALVSTAGTLPINLSLMHRWLGC
ncbi:unnamed protein product [Mycena citricolor]|uniref:Retrovirus-related Pol polyprotein from transposon TNT 1-94-like beta-barrel domain-containing protein n=1 Tax=Mycena citricolor TaxID=2018698 RepID=A0AAD2HUQ6_9AGAR|nr:unnamed protein product [Mycena citricolor]